MEKVNPMQTIMKEVRKEHPLFWNYDTRYIMHVLADYSQYVEAELDKLRQDNGSKDIYKEIYMLRQVQYLEEKLFS